MRNWMYVNSMMLVLLIVLMVTYPKWAGGMLSTEDVLVAFIPAPLFIWGIAICRVIQIQLRMGSIKYAVGGRVTCIVMAILAIAAMVLTLVLMGVAINFNAAGTILVLFLALCVLVLFAAMVLATDQVLKKAIRTKSEMGMGFPVELNAVEEAPDSRK